MGPEMPSGRYEFYRDENETLTLVFDDETSRCDVQVWGPNLQRSRIPLTDFGRSEDGVRHADSLMAAIRSLENDVPEV